MTTEKDEDISILKRLVMCWRYNKAKELAGEAFVLGIKHPDVLEFQHASKLLGEAADLLKKRSHM